MLSTQQLIANVIRVVIQPLVELLIAAGLLVFIWGLIEFLLALNELGEYSKEDGKRHMFWGIVGMFVMVAAVSILYFLANNICGGINSCYTF